MKAKIFFLILFFLFTGGLACQRSTETSKVNLSIQVPNEMSDQKVQTQSASTLAHLVINISGSGMDAIVFTWDRHGPNGTELTPPNSYEFQLNQGSGRLIQVLAVYKTSTTSSMGFYYDDETVDLNAAEQNININVVNVAQGNVLSGNISGRYLTGANSGPTGAIDIRYQPPGGKPEMSVEKGYIVNGWFNLFALTSVSLRYVVAGGMSLWDGPVSLDSAYFSTSSNQISRVSIPVSKRKEYQGGSYSWAAEEAKVYVYGWFGPAVSSQVVCQPSSLGSFSNLVNYNAPVINGSSPSAGYFLSLVASSAPPSIAELTNMASASSYAVVAYGVTSSSTCAALTELTNKITLTQDQVDGKGRDGAAAFFPPFTKMGSQSSPFMTQNSSGVHSISGALLPDLYPDTIDGLKIYKRTVNETWGYPFETFSCPSAAAGFANFSLVADVSGGAFASGILPFTPVLASGENAYLGTAVLACPVKNGVLADWGVLMKGSNF